MRKKLKMLLIISLQTILLGSLTGYNYETNLSSNALQKPLNAVATKQDTTRVSAAKSLTLAKFKQMRDRFGQSYTYFGLFGSGVRFYT